MIEEVKHLFTPGPMVSFRSPRKISIYLVRAKLYPVERPVGSYHVARFVLPVRLHNNLKKLIVNMTAGRNTWFFSLLLRNVENNVWVKQLILFVTGGIITDLTLVTVRMTCHTCKNTLTNIFVILNMVVFSKLFLTKTTLPTLFKEKIYLKHNLKTIVPYGLNIKKNLQLLHSLFWSWLHELLLFTYLLLLLHFMPTIVSYTFCFYLNESYCSYLGMRGC